MRALALRLQQGSISRKDWSTLASLVLLTQGDGFAAEVAAKGLDEFIRIAGPVFEGHAFHYSDFKRMYARICRAASPVVH
jgi:hypothetical protein